MFSGIFISIILAILPNPITMDDGKISSYCQRSQEYSFWLSYPPTPIQCCSDNQKCPLYIMPGETKFGVTNEDQKWWIRECICDMEMLKCMTEGKTGYEARQSYRYLLNDKCFQPTGKIPCEPNQSCEEKTVYEIKSLEDSKDYRDYVQSTKNT